MEKMMNMQNMPVNQIALVLLLSVLVGITALSVAFDARDRGMSKFSAIMLGLSVQMFFPIAIKWVCTSLNLPLLSSYKWAGGNEMRGNIT